MKNNSFSGFSAFLFLLFIHGLCFADTVVLNQGQTLTGDIIIEKETLLYMDIGVDVLKISKKDILQYEYAHAAAVDEDVNQISYTKNVITDANQLYRTAVLEKTTVEKSVEAVST